MNNNGQSYKYMKFGIIQYQKNENKIHNEIVFYTHLVYKILICLKCQVLDKKWSYRNVHTVLLGVKYGTAALGSSLQLSPKADLYIRYDLKIPLLGIFLRETLVLP